MSAPRCKTTGDLKRSCECRPCLGARARRKGQRRQREARAILVEIGLLDADASPARTGNEESWTGIAEAQVKSGDQVGPVRRRYEKERAKPGVVGDRPFLAISVPDGFPVLESVVAVTLGDLVAICHEMIRRGEIAGADREAREWRESLP